MKEKEAISIIIALMAAMRNRRAAFAAQVIVVAATALFIQSLTGILQLKR